MAEKKAPRKIKCPICSEATTWDGNQYRPFCGKRCKLIDLGQWADGTYSVPSEDASGIEEELEGPGRGSHEKY